MYRASLLAIKFVAVAQPISAWPAPAMAKTAFLAALRAAAGPLLTTFEKSDFKQASVYVEWLYKRSTWYESDKYMYPILCVLKPIP